MTAPDFRPTHVVPQDGMSAWESPDPSRPTVPLDALLPVQLLDRSGDWARVLCANGWSAWVDGRLLVAVPQAPPAASSPLTRTADPRPLLTRVQESLARYRSATEDLTAGRVDGEAFRTRTHGMRAGVVVDGESVWLYDAEHERWVYTDGTRLSTYAAPGEPSAEARQPARPQREATRVVREPAPEAEPPPFEERPDTGAAPEAQEPTPTDPTRLAGGTDGHEPTRVVGGADGYEPTRLVGGGKAGAARPAREPESGEPTRLVRDADDADGPEPTRVVPRVTDTPEDARPHDTRRGDV